MATKKEKFPKKLFVYREWDGEESILMAYETERECADVNETRLVGVYELRETGKILVKVVKVAA